MRVLTSLSPIKRIASCPLPTIKTDDLLKALSFLSHGEELIEGSKIWEFERKFAEYLGAKYAISFGKGRMALNAIIKALKCKKEDEAIIPAYTCFVVPNALYYARIHPIYIDIDPLTYNIDTDKLEEKITPKTKAIIPHHLYGQPCDMKHILEVAKDHDLYVIEDAAQALGAEYHGRKIGIFGDASFFSFNYTKNITTIEGGMAVTNNREIAENLREQQESMAFPPKQYICRLLFNLLNMYILSNPLLGVYGEGLNYVLGKLIRSKDLSIAPEEYMLVKPVNYPFKLCNVLASIGVSQLTMLDYYNEYRRYIAKRYDEVLQECGLPPVYVIQGAKHVYLRYTIRVKNRRVIKRFFKANRVILADDWFNYVVHPDTKYKRILGYVPGSCPLAEVSATSIIHIPLHPKMSEDDVDKVINLLRLSVSKKILRSLVDGEK
jgi:dTDP-4-amino-4,6-dideoxygalactose transaminase